VRKTVSEIDVLIATYNEEMHIEKCIDSILNQTYPMQQVKIFIIDGNSSDNTSTILRRLASFNKNIHLISNPDRYQAFAWNKAIELSTSPYISILSAHSVIPPDYLENAINILQNDNVDLTGGHMVAHGIGLISEAIAKLHHSKLGIGVGKFHDMSFEGFTDTVYTFNFKRKVIDDVGLFNTKLIRNQDIELAGRIKKNGGKIYLSSRLDAIYVPRNSIISFIKQYFCNAKFLFETLRLTYSALSVRHFVPLIFILFIPFSIYWILQSNVIALSLLASFIWLTYFSLLVFFSNKLSTSNIQFSLLMFLHPLLHIVYGCGTLWGGANLVCKKFIISND